MDHFSPQERVVNNLILFEKILQYSPYGRLDGATDSVKKGTMQLRLVNKIWCDSLLELIFRSCGNEKLKYLKLLVEEGLNDYGHLVNEVKMIITGCYKDASSRSADVITWMKEGPLVNLENVTSVHLMRRYGDGHPPSDFDGLSVVLGSCKNVQYITLEKFLPVHMGLALVKLKPTMPRGARFNIYLDTGDSSGVTSVFEQLTPEITNRVSLYIDKNCHNNRRNSDGMDLIFNTIGRYHQLWSKIESIDIDVWESFRTAREIFRSKYLRILNPIMGGNMRKVTLFISTPRDEEENPVGIELLKLFKHCFNLTHLKLHVENGPTCTVGDQWIHQFVTCNSNIVSKIRSIQVKSFTFNEDKPAFTFDSLKSLKLCTKLDTIILENLLPQPGDMGHVRSDWLAYRYYRVAKFGLQKLPPEGEVWFPSLTRFDVHSCDDWCPSLKERLRYHMPLCKWHIELIPVLNIVAK